MTPLIPKALTNVNEFNLSEVFLAKQFPHRMKFKAEKFNRIRYTVKLVLVMMVFLIRRAKEHTIYEPFPSETTG